MKELFRERDYTRVGFYQSILESAGIATHVRNQDLVTMTTDIPIPEFFPALCVVNDEDYESALDILRSHVAATAEATAGGAETVEDVPFEMRGIVLAGIVLVVGMFMAGTLLFFLGAVRDWHDSGEAATGILLSAAVVAGGVYGITRSVRSYLATRRRLRAGE